MKKLVCSFVLLFTMLFFNSCGILTPYPNPMGTGSTHGVSPINNPFYQLADVQLVGCYGNSASATVEFIFTVTSHSNLISRGTFGAYPSKFAARGQAYSPYTGTSVELVRYAPADVVLTLRDVPDYLTQFDRVELTWHFTASHHSGGDKQNLIFNYVPINWN